MRCPWRTCNKAHGYLDSQVVCARAWRHKGLAGRQVLAIATLCLRAGRAGSVNGHASATCWASSRPVCILPRTSCAQTGCPRRVNRQGRPRSTRAHMNTDRLPMPGSADGNWHPGTLTDIGAHKLVSWCTAWYQGAQPGIRTHGLVSGRMVWYQGARPGVSTLKLASGHPNELAKMCLLCCMRFHTVSWSTLVALCAATKRVPKQTASWTARDPGHGRANPMFGQPSTVRASSKHNTDTWSLPAYDCPNPPVYRCSPRRMPI